MDILNAIWVGLQPLLLEAIAGVLALVIGMAAIRLKEVFGLEIEARHSKALHSALMTGVRAAMQDGVPIDRKDELVRRAEKHARQSVPDAIERLRPDAATLKNLALRYIGPQ